MAIEPRDRLSAAKTLEASGGGRTASPWRWLLVIVPVMVILVIGTNLLGVWQLAPEEASRGAERQGPRSPEQVPEPLAAPTLAPESKEKAFNPQAVIDDARRRIEQIWPRDDGSQDELPSVPSEAAETEARFDASRVTALLANADPREGATLFRMCGACHSAAEGEPSRLGPNLWDVVGRRKAGYPDYSYSTALKAAGGAWSIEELAAFLYDPKAFMPGTRMTFRGVQDNERLANLIAYMRTLSDRPMPLPR